MQSSCDMQLGSTSFRPSLGFEIFCQLLRIGLWLQCDISTTGSLVAVPLVYDDNCCARIWQCDIAGNRAAKNGEVVMAAAEKRVAPAVSVWPASPALYEISTWVWLTDLTRKYGKHIDLSSVPSHEWDAISSYGFDAVWLMGVWERSPAGIAIANRKESLLSDFRRALPNFRPEDNVGSPYCVRRYVVDKRLGGPEGLAVARR